MFNKSRVGSGIGSGTLKSRRRIRIRNKITLDPQHWPKPQKETVKKTQIPTTVACKPNFMQVSTWSILHLLPGRSCPVVRHPWGILVRWWSMKCWIKLKREQTRRRTASTISISLKREMKPERSTWSWSWSGSSRSSLKRIFLGTYEKLFLDVLLMKETFVDTVLVCMRSSFLTRGAAFITLLKMTFTRQARTCAFWWFCKAKLVFKVQNDRRAWRGRTPMFGLPEGDDWLWREQAEGSLSDWWRIWASGCLSSAPVSLSPPIFPFY